MHKIRFIAQKEYYHILRDPRSLLIVFAMPVLMTFLYGYAINLDTENIVISIADMDRSVESRALIRRFYQSTYFSKPSYRVNLQDPEELLRAGKASAVLLIRPGFGRALQDGREFALGMTVDASDNALSPAVQAYSNALVFEYLADRFPPGFDPPGIMISQQVLFNPDLESAHFFVPGLVAIILMMISALLTSVTIAREKETGTMEQLLTSPVKPYEIMIGKLCPYVVIAFLNGLLVIAFGKIVFSVPFVGSSLLLLLFTLVYVSTALSAGILISSLVRTQQTAMMFALITTLLPSVMLSGFIFAIKNMPWLLRAMSYAVPARHYLFVIRGIMLKGAGFNELMVQGVFLVAIMLILLMIAARQFKAQAG
jgi:ABC-2 type transport system permease protein